MAKLERPFNPDLPYFAYDAFKPKQVAFPVIKYFVDYVEPFELDFYELKHRNGMPIVVDDYSTAPIKGYLIYFNDNIVEVYNKRYRINENHDAYDFICKTKPSSLFEWREEYYQGVDFNITMGQDRNYGVPYEIYKGNYDGRNDPTFFRLLHFIERNLNSMEIREDFECLYNLQMNYMLLWSSIDKYLALCNGGWFQHNNVIEWSKWEEFRRGFRGVNRYHKVHSSNSSKICYLKPNNPRGAAEYYYQLRCNIIHSSKKGVKEVFFLEDSLRELLGIFKVVLEESFNPERYNEYNLAYW